MSDEIDYSEIVNGKEVFTTVTGKRYIEKVVKSGKYKGNVWKSYGQIRDCETCGTSFFAPNNEINRNRGKYCSHECSRKYAGIKIDHSNHINGTEVFTLENGRHFVFDNSRNIRLYGDINICLTCNEEFFVLDNDINRGVGKYCSTECVHESQKESKIKKDVLEPLYYNKDLSLKDIADFLEIHVITVNKLVNKYGLTKRYSPRESSIIINCDYCGKEIRREISRLYSSNYCSIECRGNDYTLKYSGENSAVWLGGKSFEGYGLDFNKLLKLAIRERDKFECQECGIPEEEYGQALDIHHIDYDKTNNEKSNLICLCRNCHMKTNFNRDDWVIYYQDKLRCNNGK